MSTHQILKRYLTCLGGGIVLLTVVYLFQLPQSPELVADADEVPGGIAVVELFTVDGCTGGPAAEELLGQIGTESQHFSRPIYCLSYHVKKSPGTRGTLPVTDFIAQRHVAYVQRFGAKDRNTPQLIVNGERQFLGADRRGVVQAISQSLTQVGSVSLEIRVTANGDEAVVEYQAQNAPERSTLNVAWIDGGTSRESTPDGSHVHPQSHLNRVSHLQTVSLQSGGWQSINLQRTKRHPGVVIAFVEQADSGRILGATSATIGGR